MRAGRSGRSALIMIIHTHTRARAHTHTHAYLHTYIHTYMHTCIHAYIRTVDLQCMMCVCVSVCVECDVYVCRENVRVGCDSESACARKRETNKAGPP